MKKTLFEVTVKPEVGMGATVSGYSDCRVYTIIGVSQVVRSLCFKGTTSSYSITREAMSLML